MEVVRAAKPRHRDLVCGLEKENMSEESKIQMAARNKAMRRWVDKMLTDGAEGPQRSVGNGEKAKDFKEETTDRHVTLKEDCSNIQGEFYITCFL